MKEYPTDHAISSPFSKKLIMVLEQDEQIGTHFVQLIRQETPFQAILARNLSEARNILAQLKCDLVLLTDETFPDEELERLYLLPAEIEPPELLSLTLLSWTYHYRDGRDVRSVVKAVNLLLAIHNGSSPPESRGKRI